MRVGWATCILGEMSSLEGNGLSKGEICVTDQVCGQDGWIWAEFTFCIFKD